MKSGKVLVSVVMSVYNDEQYLKESLDSIFAQTIQNFELIIVDDCSTDRTVEIIENYHDDRIRLICNSENRGLTRNLNTALEYVQGTYIARMDGDDKSRPERFEKQIAYLEQHPELMLISCRTHMFGEEDLISQIQGTPKQLQAMMLIRPVLAHPGFMMRRKLIVQEGFRYDESYRSAQDYNFAARVARKFGIGVTPDILLDYRVHKKQVSSKKSGEQSNNAARVRSMQLEWLNISLDEKQRDALETWAKEIKNADLEDYRQAAKLIPLFLEQNQKTKIYAQKELEEELKKLLYQWMIRSKSVKTILQAVGVCGVSGKNCGLMIAKLAETFRYKISREY